MDWNQKKTHSEFWKLNSIVTSDKWMLILQIISIECWISTDEDKGENEKENVKWPVVLRSKTERWKLKPFVVAPPQFIYVWTWTGTNWSLSGRPGFKAEACEAVVSRLQATGGFCVVENHFFSPQLCFKRCTTERTEFSGCTNLWIRHW